MAINIRIDEKAKEELKEIARNEERTLSNLIATILHKWLKDRDRSPSKK